MIDEITKELNNCRTENEIDELTKKHREKIFMLPIQHKNDFELKIKWKKAKCVRSIK